MLHITLKKYQLSFHAKLYSANIRKKNMQHHTQQKESTLTHLPLSTLLTGVDGRIEAYPWLKPPDTITFVTNWSPFSTRKLKNAMINFMYVYMNYIPCVLNTISTYDYIR